MTPEEQAEVKKDLKAKKTLEKKQAYVKSKYLRAWPKNHSTKLQIV